MGKGVWGIDISKYSIKAVRMEASPGGLTLTAADVFPYSEEHTGEAGGSDEQVRATLEEMKAQLKIGGERVVLSLPSHSTFNRLIKLPPVDDAKIGEVVRYEAQSQIPFNIEEVLWDYQFVDREYGPGEEKEVILFAIKRDIVEQFLKGIEPVGLNVDAVQFSPVALYNYLVFDQDVGSTAVAIDMGGDNTDLVIIDGAKFWIRNLPLTGNDITKALQKAFNIPFNEAEKLKLKAGQSQQSQKIFNAIQPVLRDLVGEVHRSIGYYKSISKTVKFEKVFLLGNSAKTFNFQKFVSQSLQMPAARLDKLNHITVGSSVDQAQFSEDLGTLGTAIGLALQGHAQAKNRINLLPPVYLKKKELKKKQPFVIGIAAALYLLVFAVWFTWDGEVQALSQAYAKAKSADALAKSQKDELDKAKNIGAYWKQLNNLAVVSYERDLALKVMNLIVPNIPKNGQGDVQEGDRIWILDWKFEEMPLRPDAKGGGGSGERPLPTEKKLKVVLEVAVVKDNRSDTELTKRLSEKLLTDVIRAFDLQVSSDSPCRWSIGPKGELNALEPSSDDVRNYMLSWQSATGFENAKQPSEAERTQTQAQTFSRFAIELDIPFGADLREKLENQPAEPAKQPPAPGKAPGQKK